MSYEADYQRLSARERERQEQSARLARSAPLSVAGLSAVARQHGRYLAWLLVNLALQIAEVGILAKVHFVYLPPTSLEILRVLSALSFLGVVTPWAIQRATLDDASPRVVTERVVRRAARALFVVGLLASLALASLLALSTELRFSTPAVFRAVLVGTILAMPFDVASTSLYYHLGRFPTRVLQRDYRAISIALHALALVPLALDWPLIYLAMVVAPRIASAAAVWRVVGSGLGDLYRASPVADEQEQRLWRDVRRLALLSFGKLALMEAAMFATYAGVTRTEPNFPLLLYLAHKLIHVVTVLGLKSALSLGPRLERSARLRDAPGIADAKRRLTVTLFAALGSSALLLPILVAKRQILTWVSPLGVPFDFTPALGAAVFLVVLARGVASATVVWPTPTWVNVGRWLVPLLPVAAAMGMGRSDGGAWAGLERTEDVLAALLLLDAGVHGVYAAVVVSAGWTRQRKDPAPPTDLVELLTTRASSAALEVVWLIEAHPRSTLPADEAAWLELFGPHRRVAWGRRAWFVRSTFGTPTDLEATRVRLLTHHGAAIRRVALTVEHARRPSRILDALLEGEGPTADRLLALSQGRVAPRTTPIDPRARALLRELRGLTAPVTTTASGVVALRWMPGWWVSDGADPDAADALRGTLARRWLRHERLALIASQQREARGVVTLDGREGVELVALLPGEARSLVHDVRRLAVRRNLTLADAMERGRQVGVARSPRTRRR